MRRVRVIPALLLRGRGLVKTVRFRNPVYVGDPVNTIRIFNEKEVDEIVVLDIDATREGRGPNLPLIRELAGECFMPLAYGGGITDIAQIRALLRAGVEKVVLNTALWTQPALVTEASRLFGSQAVVASIDVRKSLLRRYRVYTASGKRDTGLDAVAAARRAEGLGAGEILLTSVDRDGTYQGYDMALIRQVTEGVSLPVVACGGASRVDDFLLAVRDGGASAVAAGSLFVFQGVHRAVLVHFPEQAMLEEQLFSRLA